jgi:hypothetical protein
MDAHYIHGVQDEDGAVGALLLLRIKHTIDNDEHLCHTRAIEYIDVMMYLGNVGSTVSYCMYMTCDI